MFLSRFLFALRSFCAILVISPIFFSLSGCKEQVQEFPRGQASVGVQVIATTTIQVDRSLPGRSVAYLTSEVRPQVGGILQERLFVEGQEVEAGKTLYQIDPKSYQAAYNAAKADLAQARAALQSAKPKAERYKSLVKIDAVSKQDYEEAFATLKQNEAAIESAKAALDSAKINLDYTKITAPIKGRIGTSTYTPGALVTANQENALTTIQQLDPIYVDVTQTSAQMLSLRKLISSGSLKEIDGKISVKILLEDGSTYQHEGTLEFVGTHVDPNTGSITLRIVVPNPDYLILPGTYVNAVLPMAINEQAILIPQSAVTRNTKGEAVVKLVDQESQKIVERIVSTSDAIKDQWVISSGLQVGDLLVISGASKVSVGQEVKIANDNVVTP